MIYMGFLGSFWCSGFMGCLKKTGRMKHPHSLLCFWKIPRARLHLSLSPHLWMGLKRPTGHQVKTTTQVSVLSEVAAWHRGQDENVLSQLAGCTSTEANPPNPPQNSQRRFTKTWLWTFDYQEKSEGWHMDHIHSWDAGFVYSKWPLKEDWTNNTKPCHRNAEKRP